VTNTFSIEFSALPSNQGMQLTAKSVTLFAFTRLAPLYALQLIADVRRQGDVNNSVMKMGPYTERVKDLRPGWYSFPWSSSQAWSLDRLAA
jgi:hypothetical protein